MNKIAQTLTAVAAIAFTSMTFAETKANEGSYNFTQVKGTSLPLMRAAGLKPTNIFILNFSDYSIRANLPNYGVDRRIDPGFTGIITNDYYGGYTDLAIYDYSGSRDPFFRQSVCRYAIVSVDYPGLFRVTVDNRYC